ncbi:hypothetical protein GOBAR_DD05927 [Gossypium barbadense]|nr:hypothetical protein GOBAR_DD05927 [Gossypium barbadense]
MEVAKISKQRTPVKDPESSSRSKTQKVPKLSENSDPNISNSSSPLTKSSKSQKCSSKNPVVLYSPRNKLRERKFVVAKKKKERFDSNPTAVIDCKCKDNNFGGNSKKCLCVAYENLRASQEEFIKKKTETEAETQEEVDLIENLREGYGSDDNQEIDDEIENSSQTGSSTIKRRRDKLMEEARNSVPDSGKVMHLWGLPGLEPPKVTTETRDSFLPSEFVLTAENLGLDQRFSVSSSWDSQRSVSSRDSNGGRRNRRNMWSQW